MSEVNDLKVITLYLNELSLKVCSEIRAERERYRREWLRENEWSGL